MNVSDSNVDGTSREIKNQNQFKHKKNRNQNGWSTKYKDIIIQQIRLLNSKMVW